MGRAEQTIMEGAAPFLEAGEEVLTALVAAPRGHTQSVAGARDLGYAQTFRVAAAAEEVGLPLEAPMALALTSRRLLSLAISNPVGMGAGVKVKDLLGAVPISKVDSIEVKRLLLGYRVTLSVRSVEMKLEAGAGARAKPLAEAFARLKADRHTKSER
jgi:hypothetical protein